MKPALQLNLATHLALTPQLQQAIRLLQLSTLALTEEIQQQVEANPLLEMEYETEDPLNVHETESVIEDFQWASLYPESTHYNSPEPVIATHDSLKSHLLWQCNLSTMSDRDRCMADYIIDCLDENGMLSVSFETLLEELQHVDPTILAEELNAVLHLVQHFDPLGCATFNGIESLLIQLDDFPNDATSALARHLIKKDIQWVANGDYTRLKKLYQVSSNQLMAAIQRIAKLHPKPGLLMLESPATEVIPDVYAKKMNQEWIVSLNQQALPKLSIQTYYTKLAKKNLTKYDVTYLKEHLQQARWLIKSIECRHHTLLKVARFLVNYQRAFLDFGEEAMQPLTLANVASALSMNESTISRISRQKYIYTPRGLFELKYFFSRTITSSNGSQHATKAIRALIKNYIETEDKRHPLTDNALKEQINAKGIRISRRTVTKYREALKIAPSKVRKQLYYCGNKEHPWK